VVVAAGVIAKPRSAARRRKAAIELSFDSDIEVITPQLEKFQFTNSGDALLSRPNRIRAHRVGGYAELVMVFDGKVVDIYAKHLNAYAQFDAPGNVDQLFEPLRAGHGVALPFADLLSSNSYDALLAGVMEAKHIGRGVVDGRECEHLALRNFDTDWQLWVDAGDKPIPRKMVITSKTLNSATQCTLRVTGWNTGFAVASTAFAFTPPASAQELRPDDLIGLEELPPDTHTGAKK
jgi:hypothetical protein